MAELHRYNWRNTALEPELTTLGGRVRTLYQGGNRSRTRSLTTSPPTRDPSCGACHMDRLGGIGIRVSWLLNPPFRLRTFTPASGTPAQYTLCSVRVLSWLCWTLTVSFTRQPCPADMEPTDGLDPSGAMIEMICLFIAALGCMTTILPCCRAFVLRSGMVPFTPQNGFDTPPKLIHVFGVFGRVSVCS